MSVSSIKPDSSLEQSPATEQLPGVKLTFWEKVEAYITRLSTRNNFWHRVCSLIWLPFAFRSGITMRRISSDRFSAVLPFKRSNRNFYNAMAGAALLGNSEVAAGMFLFKLCGSDYAVVCKHMSYKFLRPCHGPAVYRVLEAEEVSRRLEEYKEAGSEFNLDFSMEISQIKVKKGRDMRVGRCDITFHCTPKAMIRGRGKRKRAT